MEDTTPTIPQIYDDPGNSDPKNPNPKCSDPKSSDSHNPNSSIPDLQNPESNKTKLYQPSSLVKFSVFAGIFMLRILDGIPWIWGNLGVYVTSYYYVHGDDSSATSTNWLISVCSFSFNIGLLLGGLLAKKIGIRPSLLFSIVVYNLAVTLSYFALKNSATALCITFGALAGAAGGMIENCQLSLIIRWTNRYQGLSSSSVPSSNILGAVVMNLILTMFINPSNEVTNSSEANVDIFTQPDLIARVPYAFVLYGMMSFTVGMLGFFLIRINREDNNIIYDFFVSIRAKICSEKEKEDGELWLKHKPSVATYESLHDIKHKKCRRHTSETETTTPPRISIENDVANINDNSSHHITPRDALKMRSFHVLWIFNALLNYAFFVINTYYKAFGLLYIPDDHFLTVAVMVKCFVTPVCTWIAGYCVDRFGVKPTMVGVASIFCIVSSFFYLTAVDKWLYMFSMVLYGCALFSLFCLSASCCVKIFGQSHFSTIFGIILTFSNILVLVVPWFTHWILASQGWVFLFSSVGVLALSQVLILIFALTEKESF